MKVFFETGNWPAGFNALKMHSGSTT